MLVLEDVVGVGLEVEEEEEEELEAEVVAVVVEVVVVVVVAVVVVVLDGLFPAVLVRRDGEVDDVKVNSSPSLGGSSADSPLPFPLKRSSSANSRIRLN